MDSFRFIFLLSFLLRFLKAEIDEDGTNTRTRCLDEDLTDFYFFNVINALSSAIIVRKRKEF